MRTLPFAKKVHIVSHLVEGCSIRTTERLCQVHRDTIMRLGIAVGEACERLHDCLMRNLQVSLLELDELWSYVGKRQRRRRAGDAPELGDQYIYIGLDVLKKAIISFAVGKRTAATTDAFARDLRSRITNRPEIHTDGFLPYVDAIGRAFGPGVDYAMLVKKRSREESAVGLGGPATQRGPQRIAIAGSPDLSRLTTNHNERHNLTMRRHIGRLGRRTNAFSKKLRNHRAAVALHATHYNFVRVHETLRTTPAVALGVAERVWSIGELIDVALSIAPPTPQERPPAGQEPGEAAPDEPGPLLAQEGPGAHPRPSAKARQALALAEFQARLNDAAAALGSELRARDPVESRSLSGLHDYQLAERLNVLVDVPRGEASVEIVRLVACPDGTWPSVLNLLQGMTMVIEALAGPNSLQERLRIFKKLGVRWRDGGGSWDGKVTVKGWAFSVGHSDEVPAWLIAQRSS